jgi:hypothetical protein
MVMELVGNGVPSAIKHTSISLYSIEREERRYARVGSPEVGLDCEESSTTSSRNDRMDDLSVAAGVGCR